ncbi:hypothetical protein [Serratia ficaria]|uniref:hypothetical protein n=1 Tax=Serratia ficaria TaxID=61651 RepID=UPI0021841FCB|nr:hypothetical protein [Serratia ficaria]CAI1179989.1 Uncharacterised protein [Serratia ficaria]
MTFNFDMASAYDEDYPFAYPIMGLNRESSTGTFGMDGKTDYSGKGNNLITNAVFNEQGMVCVKSGGKAIIPVKESLNMTVVIALNMAARPAAAANIISSLTPGTAPFEGFRITQQPDGTASVLVATGKAAPSNTTLSLGSATGAWTMFAVSLSETEIVGMRANGNPLVQAITAGRAVSSNQLVFNGAPDGSQLTDGFEGIGGGLAVYDSVLSSDEMLEALNDMRDAMVDKGIPMP